MRFMLRFSRQESEFIVPERAGDQEADASTTPATEPASRLTAVPKAPSERSEDPLCVHDEPKWEAVSGARRGRNKMKGP